MFGMINCEANFATPWCWWGVRGVPNMMSHDIGVRMQCRYGVRLCVVIGRRDTIVSIPCGSGVDFGLNVKCYRESDIMVLLRCWNGVAFGRKCEGDVRVVWEWCHNKEDVTWRCGGGANVVLVSVQKCIREADGVEIMLKWCQIEAPMTCRCRYGADGVWIWCLSCVYPLCSHQNSIP